MAFLSAWHWKIFYRSDFAAADAFVHVPALLTYGILIFLLMKGIFAECKSQQGKMSVKTHVKIICTFVVLAAVFLAAAVISGLEGTTPVYLQGFSEAELKAYYLKETVKSIGGAATRIWPFMGAAVWLLDVFANGR